MLDALLNALPCPCEHRLWRRFDGKPPDAGRDADGNVVNRKQQRQQAKQARERAAARRRIAEREAARAAERDEQR